MKSRLRWFSAVTLVVPLFCCSCTPPSLLITPVSGRRELEETELSRDSLFALEKIALIDISGMIQNGTGA